MRKRRAAFLPVVFLAAVCIFLETEHDSLYSRLKYECYFQVVRQVFPVCMGSLDIETGGEDFDQGLMTQIESELTCETVLAMEASDENYVNQETGQVEGIFEAGPYVSEEEIVNEALTGSVAEAKVAEISMDQLRDFNYLIENFYRVDRSTTISGSQLNAEELLAKDMTLKGTAESPQILIYHTHSQERYADSVEGDRSTYVVGIGEYLAELLRSRYGLNVLHHMGEYDVEDRDNAYAKAGPALEQILQENPSIEVVIDLHRDGVGENTRLVTEVDGKPTAQIMFFNGLSRTTATGDIPYLYNPYLSDNLAFSLKMQIAAAEYYPGYTRLIYLKGYRYNMHYCPKSLLVEVGAQTNTVEEARNAMEPLAELLHKVLCP